MLAGMKPHLVVLSDKAKDSKGKRAGPIVAMTRDVFVKKSCTRVRNNF